MDGEPLEVIPPTIERVKLRFMVLFANSICAHFDPLVNSDPDALTVVRDVKAWVEQELSDELTEAEKKLHGLAPGSWTQKQSIDNSWDYEAAVSLGWAVGVIELYPEWDTVPKRIFDHFLDEFPKAKTWRLDLKLRSLIEIDEQWEKVEAHYWRIREPLRPTEDSVYARKLMQRASILGQVKLASDGDLSTSDGRSVATLSETELAPLRGMQRERLEGLNWLCGLEADWDQVTADTIVNWLWDKEWPEEPTPNEIGEPGK